jgi:hypothetical protein
LLSLPCTHYSLLGGADGVRGRKRCQVPFPRRTGERRGYLTPFPLRGLEGKRFSGMAEVQRGKTIAMLLDLVCLVKIPKRFVRENVRSFPLRC